MRVHEIASRLMLPGDREHRGVASNKEDHPPQMHQNGIDLVTTTFHLVALSLGGKVPVKWGQFKESPAFRGMETDHNAV